MTPQQAALMGDQARELLQNPAFSEALRQVHELAHQQFKKTDIRDAEGLKLARQFAAVTDDFEAILKRIVEGGKLAKLDLDKHRDESAAVKLARRFTR